MLTDYMNQVIALMKSHHLKARGVVRYSCNEELVLAEGRAYSPPPDDAFARWPKGTAQQCFANAAKLALAEDDLVYVEGFAVSVIPIAHAWCWSLAEMRVIDPTWGGAGQEFFGIPFKTNFLATALRESGSYGLLDDGRGGFPLLARHLDPAAYRDNRVMDGGLCII